MITSFDRILPFCSGPLAFILLGVMIVMPFFHGANDPPTSLKQTQIDMASMALVEVSLTHGAKVGVEGNLPYCGFSVDWESLHSERCTSDSPSHEAHKFTPISTHLVYTLTTSSNL